MPRYLALLRGINVGGRNKVAMADLRQIAAELGHTDIATYIQSGNLLFTSTDNDTAGHAAALHQRIAERLGVRPAVVVISAGQLARTIADNPFPDVTNHKSLHAVFRNDDMSAAGLTAVADAVERARATGSRDEAVVVGRTLYLHTPDGFGRSELAARLASSAAQTAGTARNWATVTTLMTMLDDGDG